jgi:hypothetical protein
MTSWREEGTPEREPRPGEKCICGKPAVTVFLVPDYVWRGELVKREPIPWCGAQRSEETDDVS